MRVGINFRKFAGFCHQIIWVPSLGSATQEMPLFSACVKVTLCSECAADLSVLSVHTHSGAATRKPCRTVSTTGDLNSCLHPLFIQKKSFYQRGSLLFQHALQRGGTRARSTRCQQGWKQGSISSESCKLIPWQGCHRRAGCIGHPATLPVHPMGSTLSPWHRNPPPCSAKPGHSDIRKSGPASFL